MNWRSMDKVWIGLTALAAAIIVLMLAFIVGNIAVNGWAKLSWEFVSQAPRGGMTEGGVFPAIYGTTLLVLLMTIFVVPLGVCVAIYFSEYADRTGWLYRASRSAVDNLAGVPSIVFGLFGLGFFVKGVGAAMDKTMFANELTFGQPAILWAALTLAVLTLPVVIVSVEEALRAVPQSFRDASLALGATKSETTFRVVLPHALPGVLTGGILAVSRGAGEVAPILFVGAAYFLPHLPTKLNDQFMELGYHIFVLTTQSPDVEQTKPLLYATVFVLLALTFLLNLTAIAIRTRLRMVAAGGR
jgi:phosphate transport system permease protein